MLSSQYSCGLKQAGINVIIYQFEFKHKLYILKRLSASGHYMYNILSHKQLKWSITTITSSIGTLTSTLTLLCYHVLSKSDVKCWRQRNILWWTLDKCDVICCENMFHVAFNMYQSCKLGVFVKITFYLEFSKNINLPFFLWIWTSVA